MPALREGPSYAGHAGKPRAWYTYRTSPLTGVPPPLADRFEPKGVCRGLHLQDRPGRGAGRRAAAVAIAVAPWQAPGPALFHEEELPAIERRHDSSVPVPARDPYYPRLRFREPPNGQRQPAR